MLDVLRPYQQNAVDKIREAFKKERGVILSLSTGAGKTVIFSHILKSLVAKGKRGVMVVRGRKLVDQAFARLTREDVPSSIVMANRNHVDAPVTVCSVDTAIARDIYPEADLVVIDEVHTAGSEGFKRFLSHYPNSFILGVTATPFPRQSLEHISSTVIEPISFDDLVSLGYLVPAKYYAPSTPNLSGVRISDDYNLGDLEKAMNKPHLVGCVVETWKKLGENRPTFCFATKVNHSKEIVARFNDQGIHAEHIDATSNDETRRDALKRFVSGETKIISNVGILGVGVDVPSVSCIIMARPTTSEILHIQQLGRATRTSDSKHNMIVLDHAGNVMRHGFINEPREPNLSGKPKPKINNAAPIKTCRACFAVVAASHTICPECQTPFPRPKMIEEKPGELSEITQAKRTEVDWKQARAYLEKLTLKQEAHGYKRGWIYIQMKARYGESVAKKLIPYRASARNSCISIGDALRGQTTLPSMEE